MRVSMLVNTPPVVPPMPRYDALEALLGCEGGCCVPGSAVLTGSAARTLVNRTRARNRGGV